MCAKHPTIGLTSMTIGAPINLQSLLTTMLLISIVAMPVVTVAAVEANASAIDIVFKQLASQPHHDVRYTEKKHSGFLDEAIILTGVLRFEPPDTIIREQLSPEKLRFIINGNIVNILRKGKEKSIKLDTIPSLQIFINSFRAILYGDLTTLKSYYKIEFSGEVSSWSISLQPRDIILATILDTIKFEGRQGVIHKIEIHENEEDWSEMTLQPITKH